LTDSGNDAGNIRAVIFWREKDAGWSTMPAVDLSGTPNIGMRGAVSYSKGAGEVWETPIGAASADDSASTAGVDPPAASTVISLAANDWLGSFAAQNGDVGTFSSHTVTVAGISIGVTVTRLGGATSGGTDLRGHVVDVPITSGTATDGPDGSMLLTSGGASTAGVMSFFRLRVSAAPVSAVMSAPLGALTAASSGTVVPRIEATASAPLGAVTATVSAGIEKVTTASAPLGALTATLGATPTKIATASASLGNLIGTINAKRSIPTTMVASLGSVIAAIQAKIEHDVVMAANLGGLTGTMVAKIKVPSVLNAPLGSISGSITPTIKVPSVFYAPLGALSGAITATIPDTINMYLGDTPVTALYLGDVPVTIGTP
jgi:hypothetical protein